MKVFTSTPSGSGETLIVPTSETLKQVFFYQGFNPFLTFQRLGVDPLPEVRSIKFLSFYVKIKFKDILSKMELLRRAEILSLYIYLMKKLEIQRQE